jgi:hypothetical protein
MKTSQSQIKNFLILSFILLCPTGAAMAVETRCGWLVNPTPANWWITDSQATWIISVQGGFRAKGMDNIEEPKEFVKTNGNYGYSCACMDVVSNYKQKRILSIQSVEQLPLKNCQADKSLLPR